MGKPKISIIVPVYNVEKYVKDCLDSVLRQSFDEYEVICVDDGSTDNSYAVVREYARENSRIKLFHQENQGQSVARNVAMQYAKGEYLCFLDSDDMLVEDALCKMWDAVKEDMPDILSYEVACLLYENSQLENKDEYYRIAKDYPNIRTGREFFVEMVENHDFIETVWLLLIRADWLKEKGYVFAPGMFYEDGVFVLQCYFACERMKHIKECLYIYRMRENSTMTQKFTPRHWRSGIWQLGECLNMIYTQAQARREMCALARYSEQILGNIRYMYACLERENANGKKEEYLGNVLNTLKKYRGIILYGAGQTGSKVKKFLECQGLAEKIIGFAVSDNADAIMKKAGVMVRCIDDYQPKEDTVVMICARNNYHKDMMKMAEEAGFHNLLAVDCELEIAMEAVE